MNTIRCQGCGGEYPYEQVAHFAQFVCSACGGTVVVPATTPIAMPARPTGVPVARPVDPPPRRAAAPAAPGGGAGRPRRPRRRLPGASQPPVVVVGAVIGGLALVAAVVVMARRGGDAPSGDTAAVPSAGASTKVAAPAATKEPERDAGAWARLAPAARASRIAELLALADTADDTALRLSCVGLQQRGAEESAREIAARYLQRNPTSVWANELRGRREVTAPIRETLDSCEYARDADIDAARRLEDLLEEHTQTAKTWWVEGAERDEIEALLAEVVRENAELEHSEAARARAHWVAYRRTVPVLREFATVDDHVGPYLILAQVPASKGSRVTDAKPEDVEKARKTLAAGVELHRSLYDAWTSQIAPVFGFRCLGADDVDANSMQKVMIFADVDTYARYLASIGDVLAIATRARYSLDEPRFVCVLGGDASRQAECRETARQLVQFHTWDTTRVAVGRAPGWAECAVRPLWTSEGFPEFFASHTVSDGVYRFMQPNEEHLQEIWILAELAQGLGWKPWTLDEIVSLRDADQLQSAARARAARPTDTLLADAAMTRLFYDDAWSLVYFLWFHGEPQPTYRAGFVRYLRREFELDFGQGSGGARTTRPRQIGESDFFAALGLESGAQREKLERAWREWQVEIIAAHRRPEWDAERDRVRRAFENAGR